VTVAIGPDEVEVGPVLEVDDLRVTYRTEAGPVPAVRGVSFRVDRGEVLGLAGESGCGKSTVAHALLRLLAPGATATGRVSLGGEDVLSMRAGRLRAVRWSGASIVFQGAMHGLNPVQRVGDQIAEPMLIQRARGPKEAGRRVGDLLERVGIAARRARDYPHELSGGQRQRVMIAMALACDPDLVIADEPSTALDVMVQAQVLELLKGLQRNLGLAMLFITHDLSVMVEVCDRIAVMYAGRIVEDGPARKVFETPRHPYTEALAAAFPRIGDRRFRRAPVGLGGDPPDPQRLPSGCSFHPRCPKAFEDCPGLDPMLTPAGPGQAAACLLVEGAHERAVPVDAGRREPAT
jgi:peptide/nickel transport system ATP-binding protein